MKINPGDYEVLKAKITEAVNSSLVDSTNYAENFLSPQRYRWDMLYLSRVKIGDGVGTHGDVNLYAYMNDDHIDTALRQIMRDLGDDWAAGT